MRACVVFAGAVGGWVGPWAPPATPVARLATTVRMSDAENPFDWAPEAATPDYDDADSTPGEEVIGSVFPTAQDADDDSKPLGWATDMGLPNQAAGSYGGRADGVRHEANTPPAPEEAEKMGSALVAAASGL